MYKLVLLRHGQSEWNKKNLFTGWTDVDLSKQGVEEAQHAGKLLQEHGFEFDLAFTSVLKRATRTLDIVLEEMSMENIPVERSWRLNERHYGALQGLNKADAAREHGDEQVHIWRRSFDVRPPALTKDDPRYPGLDPLYSNLNESEFPLCESLQDTIKRFLPYWFETIRPAILSGKKVIIAAHGNSLRGLIKELDNIDDQDIVGLEIPTGQPLIYELDSNIKPLKSFYLS